MIKYFSEQIYIFHYLPQIDLQATQLIIPYGGFYNGTESLLVVNFGSFKMQSLEKPQDESANVTVKQLVSMGKSEEDILTHLRQYSYDKFVLKIVNFQVCSKCY